MTKVKRRSRSTFWLHEIHIILLHFFLNSLTINKNWDEASPAPECNPAGSRRATLFDNFISTDSLEILINEYINQNKRLQKFEEINIDPVLKSNPTMKVLARHKTFLKNITESRMQMKVEKSKCQQENVVSSKTKQVVGLVGEEESCSDKTRRICERC